MAQGFGVASSVPLARGATINWGIETFAHIPPTNTIIYNISIYFTSSCSLLSVNVERRKEGGKEMVDPEIRHVSNKPTRDYSTFQMTRERGP